MTLAVETKRNWNDGRRRRLSAAHHVAGAISQAVANNSITAATARVL